MNIPMSFNEWFAANEDKYFWITNDVFHLTDKEEEQLMADYLEYLRAFNDE